VAQLRRSAKSDNPTVNLSNDTYTIELINEQSGFDPSSADNSICYDKVFSLSDRTTSTHGIRVCSDGGEIVSAIILAGGGASGIHSHSAILRPDSLIIAVGPFAVRLRIPSLDILWFTQTDEATCFGVHSIPDSSDFISHGELSIARVTGNGHIVWSEYGADIFTGDFTISPDEVRVADFEDRRYAFDLRTGASRMLSPA